MVSEGHVSGQIAHNLHHGTEMKGTLPVFKFCNKPQFLVIFADRPIRVIAGTSMELGCDVKPEHLTGGAGR